MFGLFKTLWHNSLLLWVKKTRCYSTVGLVQLFKCFFPLAQTQAENWNLCNCLQLLCSIHSISWRHLKQSTVVTDLKARNTNIWQTSHKGSGTSGPLWHWSLALPFSLPNWKAAAPWRGGNVSWLQLLLLVFPPQLCFFISHLFMPNHWLAALSLPPLPC